MLTREYFPWAEGDQTEDHLSIEHLLSNFVKEHLSSDQASFEGCRMIIPRTSKKYVVIDKATAPPGS